MRRRTAILLVFALVAAYLGSYLFYSRNGLYIPKAFGAVRLQDGRSVIAAKGFGKIWEPSGFVKSEEEYHVSGILEISYMPMVFIDRLIWHREVKEVDGVQLGITSGSDLH